MKSIGQVIRTYRERQEWSAQRLSKETSVPLEMIEALENERFHELPAAPLVRGYLQLIAQSLGIPEDTAIALWRRDAPTPVESSLQSRSETSPFRGRSWWRPQLISWASFGILVVVVVLVLIWQWREVGRPPDLTVENLENFSVLPAPIEIRGQTDPNATLTINTQLVSLDPQGYFTYLIDLPTGERTIVLQSTDAQGRVAEEIYFVTVE